jgi:hypothetical protein
MRYLRQMGQVHIFISHYGFFVYVDKLIYDELDHITHPSACLELRNIPPISEYRQGPHLSIEKTQPGKVDDDDMASVQSLLSEPSSMVAQKSRATVESWFSRLSTSATNPSPESPVKSTPRQGAEALSQGVKLEQAESASVARVSHYREVASQTDPVLPNEKPASLPAGTPMPPSFVPLGPVHTLPNCK